jgi:hypothetical protein
MCYTAVDVLYSDCTWIDATQAAERAGFSWELTLSGEETHGEPGHAALQEAVGKGEYVSVGVGEVRVSLVSRHLCIVCRMGREHQRYRMCFVWVLCCESKHRRGVLMVLPCCPSLPAGDTPGARHSAGRAA